MITTGRGERSPASGASGAGERIGGILEALPDGILVVTADGRISAVNGRIEELFGYTRDNLVGQPVEMLLPAHLRAAHRVLRKGYEAAPEARPMGTGLDLVGRRKDGTDFWVDVSLSPVGHDGAEVVAVVRDVTSARQEEARLGYLAAIIDSSHDAIYSQDADGLITAWNQASQLLFGYGPEVIGWRSTRLFAEQRWEDHELVLRRVLAGEVHQHFETEVKRRDGLIVPISLSLSPIRDHHGHVVGASAIARDVSEQRLALATLAENEARLREGESLAHVGGWVLDAATGTVQWSEELYRIHGIDPADFAGTIDAHVALAHEDDGQRLRATIASAVAGAEIVEDEYRILRPDGQCRWLYTRAATAVGEDGGVIGLRGICQDITDRRQAEEAIREAYERERAAAEGLRAADALKDEFLATVSHELRTPLTSIVGFSMLMASDDRTLPFTDMGNRILRNAREMEGMVERLLDFSRLEAGRVELRLERLALTDVIASFVGSKPEIGDHTLTESVPQGVDVVADREGTRHVLGNLVSNSAKFAPPGTSIEITAGVEGDTAVIAVRDHGPGIPPALLDQVFERFFQAPDQPPGKRGAGVGLSIVRRYVELQGGRVWCESAVPGVEFRFTLPLAEPRVT